MILIPDSQRYPEKFCLIKYELDLNLMFINSKNYFYQMCFSTKVTCAFQLQESMLQLSDLNTFKSKKRQYLPH